MFFLPMESPLTEDVILFSIMFTLIIVLAAISATLSWGWVTISDCLAYDPRSHLSATQ